MRTFVILLLASLSLSLSAQNSQSRPSSEGEPLTYPTIQFSIYVWPNNSIMLSSSKIEAIPRLFYDSPSGRTMLSLARNASSPLYTYIGPQPLTLYDYELEEVPPPEGALPTTVPIFREKIKPRIKATIPPGLDRVILVLFPGKHKPDGTLLTIPMAYESAALQPGSARIYNSTQRPIALQFVDTKGPILKLKPNENTDFFPNELFEGDYVRVFGYAPGADNEAERVHVSKMYFEEGQANFFIMYDQGKRVRMIRIGGHEIGKNQTALNLENSRP